MESEILKNEIDRLRAKGFEVELSLSDGFHHVVFERYEFPKGYSTDVSSMLLRLPISYPNGRPDMFWTDVNVTLMGGGIPERANTIEQFLGKQWRRFSWHPQNWNPGIDTLETFLEFVNRRLAQVK